MHAEILPRIGGGKKKNVKQAKLSDSQWLCDLFTNTLCGSKNKYRTSLSQQRAWGSKGHEYPKLQIFSEEI